MRLRLHNEFRDELWYMTWFDADDGDYGATLGECLTDGMGDAPTNRGDWEHYIAVKTIHDLFPNTRRTDRGWAWESRSAAAKAWSAVKQAMNQERPLPEWAKTALQEGWKPPKTWKA